MSNSLTMCASASESVGRTKQRNESSMEDDSMSKSQERGRSALRSVPT